MGKRMKRAKQNSHNSNNNDVIQLDVYRSRKSKVIIIPRNIHQEEYIEMLDNSKKNIVFAIGPAGTGKTLLAVQSAIVNLKKGNVEKIVITRPAVSVDEQHGFLPGTLIDKMAPWTKPIFDVFEQYWAPKQIANMIEEGIIEIAPLAFMRGRTFKKAWILADEMQNATPSQMKMLLTRIGTGSKIVVTGDLAQHDRGYENNGLKEFMELFDQKESRRIHTVYFDNKDIERHPAVKEVLEIYGDCQ
jgi:phosphate starvation-inducible PhoH-like protein|tara:strand:- start:304 stop:1038 length:735 start_codon:yes stop_codon:yes gene_type:complete